MRHRLHIRWRKELPPLPWGVRVAVLGLGWLCVGLGIAGLFLPFLQGVLFIVLGLALISLTSQRAHRFLRGRFSRWPKGWRLIEKSRRFIHRKLHRQ